MIPRSEAWLLTTSNSRVYRGYQLLYLPPGTDAEWGGIEGVTLWFEGETEEEVKRKIDEAYG